MNDDPSQDEVLSLGTKLVKPAATKLIEAANAHIKAQRPELAGFLYFGALSYVASTAAAHLGIAHTVRMLESCIQALRGAARRQQH